MAWVKRGGGAGTGIYGQGLAAAVAGHGKATDTPRCERPAVRDDGPRPGENETSADPAAYAPTRASEVTDSRVLLDVIARWVRDGNHGEDSMLYEDALAAFGPDSAHLAGACRGERGAGAHYQNTVAGGRYRDRS